MVETIIVYAFLALLFFGGSAAGFVQHLQSRRHKFKLALQREKTKQKEAEAKLLVEQNRKAAIDLRAAELELERWDRTVPGAPARPPLPSGVDPTQLPETDQAD